MSLRFPHSAPSPLCYLFFLCNLIICVVLLIVVFLVVFLTWTILYLSVSCFCSWRLFVLCLRHQTLWSVGSSCLFSVCVCSLCLKKEEVFYVCVSVCLLMSVPVSISVHVCDLCVLSVRPLCVCVSLYPFCVFCVRVCECTLSSVCS